MPIQVVNGAQLMCSFGAGPGAYVVLPINRTLSSNQPAATIMDFVPMLNIMPFPACMSIANPVVAAATAAKLGVFTPAACVPAVTAPWAPGSPTKLIAMLPALNNTSTCMCQWGGVITVAFPGQVTEMIP
jgi:hypothetical protein